MGKNTQNSKKSISKTIEYLEAKYGYKLKLNKTDIEYIFETTNISGIESRYISLIHYRLLTGVIKWI